MGYQTEVKIGGPLRLPASAALVAQANPEGRGVVWDSSNANLVLAGDDDRVEYIVDEIHSSDSEASVYPFSAERNFRVRAGATVGAVAKGKLIKVDTSGGVFVLGGGVSDVNVAVCEEPSGNSGALLVRALPGGTVTT